MEEFEQAIKESIKNTKITTTVEPEWKTIKEKYGYTWKELIGLGLKAKRDNPQLIERINNNENEIQILKRKINHIYNKYESHHFK